MPGQIKTLALIQDVINNGSGITNPVVTTNTVQVITGAKTINTLTVPTALDLTSVVLTRPARSWQISAPAKIGTTAGWLVAAADNKNSIGRCPASQTASTLVIPVSGLMIGDIITGYNLFGQIESAGGAVTLDAAIRTQTAAAADLTDAAIGSGSITQVAVTADTIISSSNAVVTGLTTTVTAGVSYYLLLTATTAASTDIDLQGAVITFTQK